MKFKEILEKVGVGDDERARRVLNVSSSKANITADEIEAGVTIERLSAIGVPVLRYATQVTIHGRLPDFNPESRPGGYCSVFKNANGSVGVRYVAIDAAKKEKIVRASRYSPNPRKWFAKLSSTGLEVYAQFTEKEECIAAYREFPRSLIFGSVCAAAGVYGGYYVFVTVGAVLEENLWKFTQALWGIDSEIGLSARAEAEKQRMEASQQEMAVRQAQAKAGNAAKRSAFATEFAKTHARLRTLPTGPGVFLRISGSFGTTEPAAWLYAIAKRGPMLCHRSERYAGQVSPSTEGKMRKYDQLQRRIIQEDFDGGFLFKV